MQFARGWQNGESYAIKFFTAASREAFEREQALYSNSVLRDMMPAVKLIEGNAEQGITSPSGWPLPPFIVIEQVTSFFARAVCICLAQLHLLALRASPGGACTHQLSSVQPQAAVAVALSDCMCHLSHL